MQIEVRGTANLRPMEAQLIAARRQAELFNAELAKTSSIPMGGTPAGFRQTAGQMGAMTRAFDSAMAASGRFTVQQVKLNDVVARNTDLLRRQKLGISEVFGKKSQAMMQQVYREQLAMQQMMVRSVKGGIGDGRLKASLYIPTEVHKSWDTLANRIGMVGYRLGSASRSLLNFGKNTQWAGRQLMAGLTYPMVAFGAAAGIMAYKVDQQFTRVRKVYDTTANQFSGNTEDMIAAQKELDQVRKDGTATAISAAKNYGAAMSDTIGVQADLAATGQKGASLQKATTEVVKNAMLGEIDYQTTTKATIALQQQLHLSTGQLADDWAYMNSVENATSLSMKDFATAIPIALGPIKTMGGDLQDLGTLLTGMISRGVQIGKAANAIKALPQRLSRPSKQVQEEFMALTGQDIVEMNKKNPDNIIGLLTDIYDATKNLDTLSKRKVFAGLFGSFQLSNMEAMVESMGDLQKGIGQVSTAQHIGNQGAKEWGKVQRQEIEAFQKSVSGRFKIALETIKASLATAGEPFLEMATHVLGALTKIISTFNSMRPIVKKSIMGLLIFGAIVGPAIMLVGLLANLAANMGLMASWVLKLVSRFNLLNKEEEANNMINALAAKGLTNRATQTALLTERVQALTVALNEQMAAYHGTSSMAPLPPIASSSTTMLGMPLGLTKAPSKAAGYGARASDLKLQRESALAASAAERERLNAQVALNAQAAAETRIREKTSAVMSRTNILMGGMGAAMAVNLIFANKTTDAISKWSMFALLALPAINGVVKGMTSVAKAAIVSAAAQRAALMASAGGAANTAKLATSAGVFRAGMAGAGSAIYAFLGPIGIAAAVLGGIGIAVYKIHQHEVAITKEQEAQNRAMYAQNNLLEDQLKITARKQKSFTVNSVARLPGGPTAEELATSLKADDASKPLIADLKQHESGSVQEEAIIMQKYRQVLEATGGSAKKATLYIQALYIAAGDGALEAQTKAEKLNAAIGGVFDTGDKERLWTDQIQKALDAKWDNSSLKEQGTALGKDFADSIVAGGKANADSTMSQMAKLFGDQLGDEWTKTITSLTPTLASDFSKLGINSFEALQAAQEKWNKDPSKGIQAANAVGIVGDAAAELDQFMASFNTEGTRAGAIMGVQASAAKEIAREVGLSEEAIKNINNLSEVRNTWEWKLQTATKANAVNLYNQQVAATLGVSALEDMDPANKKINDSYKLQIARQLLLSLGLKDTENLSTAIAELMGATADNTDKAAKAAKGLSDAFKLTDDNMKSILHDSMQGVQDDIASAMSDQFDTRMNNAIDAEQSRWDAREKALDDAQDRQDRQFDNRWDRRKKALQKYYQTQADAVDRQIKKEEKAEALRQKIFDAEEKRINRLAEMANRNIDFNVALRTGNLDEAAKIANDAQAAMQANAIEDAAGQGADASQAHVDALNKQKDLLDKQEQQAEDAQSKREAREKAHLEKIQEIQKDSLKAQADAAIKAYKADWDRRKASLDDQIALFKSFLPRNQAELENWMKQTGVSYDQFGKSVMAKGESWSKFFQTSLHKHILLAGNEVASSGVWSQWGADEAKSTLMGMGFAGMGQFRKFLKTGKLPNNFGKPKTNNPTPDSGRDPNNGQVPTSMQHEGGWVGSAKNSRKGVARNQKGLHQSEQMVLAQKGEYVVDRKTASKYGNVLESMQNGEVDNRFGGPTGIAGFVGAAMAKGLATGVGQAFKNAVAAKQKAMGPSSYAAGAAGSVGGFTLDAEQLRMAAIIANVGSAAGFGANSARAIEIGIMTALDESGMRNINFGDRDSVGLFQQRTSQGWGTLEQIMDPKYAAGKFFSALKGVSGWANMDPWVAAQAVQRSGTPDGSNYRRFWEEAVAVYTNGLVSSAGAPGTMVPGAGGYQRASKAGHGWYGGDSQHDYLNPLNSPVYAFNNGKVVESRAITSGGSPGNGLYSTPYRSYGETIVVEDANGTQVRYGHLNSRWVKVGDVVSGGAQIGLSGQTGNAGGPHTHFEVDGKEIARSWFNAHGIGLKGGGYTTRDVPSVVHKDEMVIDKKRTKQLYGMVDNFTGMSGFWTWLSGLAPIGPHGMPVWNPEKFSDAGDVPPKSGNSKNVKIGTYNVKFSSSNDDTKEDLNKLLPQADILSLTEFVKSKRDLIPWMRKEGWGVAGASGDNESVVAYNRARFGLGAVGSVPLNHTAGMGLAGRGKGGARANVTAAYAQLIDKVNGSKLWQIAAHTIAHIWKDPTLNRKVQQEQFGALGSLASRLGKDGTPVFVGGDFNNDPRNIAGSRPGGQQGMANFAPMTAAGLKSNWTAEDFKKYPGGTMGGRFIDAIFSSKAAKVLNSKIVGGLHSDHNAAISEFSLPQLSKGGNIRWDNTVANLHKKETVLTEELSEKFKRGVDNFASGGQAVYNTHVTLNGTDLSARDVAVEVEKIQRKHASRLPSARSTR